MACTFVPLKAQMNLVPNPSFEDVVFCPNGMSQIYLATPWENYRISPDIFCECSPLGVSIPQNNLGYQFAKSGECVAGLMTFRKQSSPNGPNCREYIGIQLNQSLVIGNEYFFSVNINCADGPTVVISSNKFGMKLLTTGLDSTQGHLLTTNSATIFSDSIISDTTNWFKITGSFVADSAYTHMVLGNFFDDLNTDTSSFKQGFIDYTYYYIDDVCLSSDSTFCENFTSISEIDNNLRNSISLYPNPAYNSISINSESYFESISIFNIFGSRIFFYDDLIKQSISLNIDVLEAGIYLVAVKTGNVIKFEKLVKL